MSSPSQTVVPVVQLKAGAERRIRSGHRWVYSNEIDVPVGDYRALDVGSCATLQSARGDVLGSAYFNRHALQCGRLYHRVGDCPLDAHLLQQRLTRALRWREQQFDAPFYRLVYGDGDDLPGLVVDRYGDYLVVQLTTAGMVHLRDSVFDALQALLAPAGILWRNDKINDIEHLDAVQDVVRGNMPADVALEENGVVFHMSPRDGQKTGWFYDHRDNRRQFAGFARGGRVLDVYSYVGGWGVQALAAGAVSLTCLDSSAQALDLAAGNAATYGATTDNGRFSALLGNAIDSMKALAAAGETFDAVVLDPPAFIKRRKDYKSGLQAYHRANQLAVKLLAPGAMLVSASCSAPLDEEALVAVLATAAHKAGRSATLVGRGSLAADHPLLPTIPEMNYLKAVFARFD